MGDMGTREEPTLHELTQRCPAPRADPLAPRADPLAPRADPLAPRADPLAPMAVPAPGYEDLHSVLVRAHNQAAYGKGNERHATGQPFAEQPIMKLTELYGPGFPLGQAGKKMQEALRLPKDAAVRELLGAINYIAAYVITLEKGE